MEINKNVNKFSKVITDYLLRSTFTNECYVYFKGSGEMLKITVEPHSSTIIAIPEDNPVMINGVHSPKCQCVECVLKESCCE